jgi:putative transposase
MSQTVSASTGATYGVEQVCVVWEQARSTFYNRRERAQKLCHGIKQGKRGPKPLVPGAELLDLIRHDFACSPFRGEGHRKVWGRLHFGQGLRVSRKRVLRLMRDFSQQAA